MNITGVHPATKVQSTVQRDLDRLREVSGRVMGSVFFGTLLKTMRNSTLKGAYGHGGRGEEVFAAQLDEILAERVGTANSLGLTRVLFDRFQGQQQRVSQARAAT
jgi:Rod binding domain-containing protein